MPWWKSVPRHFPLTQGPYVPGCMDLMSGFTSEGVFARLYYPTSVPKIENDHKKWFKWSPHDKYIEGFAKLVHGYATLIKMVVWTYGGEPLVPCVWEGAPLKNEIKMPVIVFSHEFGASRFICATIAAELASWGFLFAAIEHRETSAAATYYYENKEARDNDDKTWIPHTRIQFGPNHYAIRNEQVHQRVAELKKLIDVIEDINNGTAENIINSPFKLSDFKGQLDLSSISMMGHSFGGAASLLTLAKDSRPSSAVILDGWMFPIKEETLTIPKPLLFINTETFHIEANLTAMKKIISDPPGAIRDVFTLKDTTHETHTDTPQVMGYWLDWFKTKLDPVVGTKISNNLILSFFNKTLGFPTKIEETEKYLENYASVILPGTHLFSKRAKNPTASKY